MIRLIMFLSLIIIACNNAPQNKIGNQTNVISCKRKCSDDYDSLLLKYAYSFEPTTMNLFKSLSPELNTFLQNVDTNCLRQQKDYKLFVATILAKLYLFHLRCCNQGYDLQSMETGGAKIIIEEFKKIAGYQNQRLEMLNSATITDYIKNHLELRQNKILDELLKQINKEAKRIDKRDI